MHPTNLSILVRGYLNAAGIKKPGSCHMLRHTTATLMVITQRETTATKARTFKHTFSIARQIMETPAKTIQQSFRLGARSNMPRLSTVWLMSLAIVNVSPVCTYVFFSFNRPYRYESTMSMFGWVVLTSLIALALSVVSMGVSKRLRIPFLVASSIATIASSVIAYLVFVFIENAT